MGAGADYAPCEVSVILARGAPTRYQCAPRADDQPSVVAFCLDEHGSARLKSLHIALDRPKAALK